MKPRLLLRLPCALALVAVTAAAPATARADEWEKIVDNGGYTVEINASAVFSAEHSAKVSWGRIVLNDSEAKQAGYRTIKALNRYDCLGRNFTTIKRVYMDDQGDILREEAVPEQHPMTVRNNSIDEQIWRKVCGLPEAPVVAERDRKAAPATAARRDRKAAQKKAMNRLDKLADAADRAARNALQPAEPVPASRNIPASPPEESPVSQQIAPADSVEAAPSPPRAMLLPVADALQKPPLTLAATDSPSTSPPVTLVPPLPPQIKPIPMPAVPQTPAAPKRPEFPAAPPLQKRPPDASPPPRREPAAQPLVLPAPATPKQSSANRRPPTPAQLIAPSPEEGEDWGYSGAIGPEFWGRMRPEWKLCDEGKRQSPIDFTEGKPIAVDLDPVKLDYRPGSFVLINAPRQLRVKIAEGMSMEVRGQRFALEGFTLHRPAETRIGEKMADMEAHFFHRDGNGRIAVLAVQFARGGQSSAPLQALLNNLPLERGDRYTPQATLDMAAFLPASPAHYLYMGSLTMPPCTEGVLWVVMKEPMTLSDEQFDVFSRLHENNARPPQPAFERLILESR
ncbi:MAG: carbonic anhydrase family protein [Betaproteobacteria bacterium]|nr:carbonic anhydrase family protein [Betaproteobacteria bacterium]